MKKISIVVAIVTILWVVFSQTSRSAYVAPDETEIFLDKLAMCESSNRPNIIVLDSNNKYSYGLYQFQETTFLQYAKKYGYIKYSEDGEILNIIHDPILQRNVARRMYLDEIADRHWVVCTQKIASGII